MIGELMAVVPPPEGPVGVATAAEWAAAEGALGVELPEDLKQVNAAYGAGWFDRFISLLSPRAVGPVQGIAEYRTEDAAVLEALVTEYADLMAAPEPLRLIPVGWTRRRDELFYLVRAGAVTDLVVAPTRTAGVYRYPETVSSFLAGVLGRRLRCPAFPDRFPSAEVGFRGV